MAFIQEVLQGQHFGVRCLHLFIVFFKVACTYAYGPPTGAPGTYERDECLMPAATQALHPYSVYVPSLEY